VVKWITEISDIKKEESIKTPLFLYPQINIKTRPIDSPIIALLNLMLSHRLVALAIRALPCLFDRQVLPEHQKLSLFFSRKHKIIQILLVYFEIHLV